MADNVPYENGDKGIGLTIAILGCGKLGTALLQGFLLSSQRLRPSTLDTTQSPASASLLSSSSSSTHLQAGIARIVVTVRQRESLERVERAVQATQRNFAYDPDVAPAVTVLLQEANAQAVEAADIVVLGCKPSSFRAVLSNEAIRQACLHSVPKDRKILVSIMGGVTSDQLEESLYGHEKQDPAAGRGISPASSSLATSRARCPIIRAIPSMVARIQESMTVLSCSVAPTQQHLQIAAVIARIDALFRHVGTTKWVPEAKMNHASALCASSLAFYATVIQAAAEGVTGTGTGELPWMGQLPGTGEMTMFSREDALEMSARVARGAAGLVLAGQAPERIRDEVATKGGSTRVGLRVLGERGVGEAIGEAVRATAEATWGLATGGVAKEEETEGRK